MPDDWPIVAGDVGDTPEDDYLTWEGDDERVIVAPHFLIYDYSSADWSPTSRRLSHGRSHSPMSALNRL